MASNPDIEKLVPRNPIDEAEALARLSRHRAKPATPGTPSFANRLHKITRPILKDEGPGIGQIRARWKDLVGERLAKISKPIKLTGKQGELVLTLEILPAAAPLFQHQGDALRQKLSVLTGGGLKSIKYVHSSQAKTASKSPKWTAPLPMKDEEALKAGLQGIKNPQLTQVLLAFGKAVYTQEKK